MEKTTLIAVTWGHGDKADISQSMLMKSFKKYNSLDTFHHIHFNRSHYQQLEHEFHAKYGYQFEFLLYRVFLLKNALQNILATKDFDRVVFCDTGDVTCQGSIQEIPNHFDLDTFVVFGAEKNQWPGVEAKKKWESYVDYSSFDLNNRYFVNGGTFLTKLKPYIDLLDACITNILPIVPSSTHLLCYGGDQGVYTYYYNVLNKTTLIPKIKLDYNNTLVLNTFSTSVEDYYLQKSKVYSKHTGVAPCFIHDNGWDHGCPRLNHAFKLEEIYGN